MKRISEVVNFVSTIIACMGLSVVAFSCAAHRKPPCVSYCGMLLEDKGNGSISCDVLGEAEKTMLDNIDKEFCRKDARMCKKTMCDEIFGWQVSADEHVIVYSTFDMPDGGTINFPAVGTSNCDTKFMWLGANQDWRHGSYPHEIFHVLQRCRSGWKDEGESKDHGPGHEGWESHGIYSFIDDFRQERR